MESSALRCQGHFGRGCEEEGASQPQRDLPAALWTTATRECVLPRVEGGVLCAHGRAGADPGADGSERVVRKYRMLRRQHGRSFLGHGCDVDDIGSVGWMAECSAQPGRTRVRDPAAQPLAREYAVTGQRPAAGAGPGGSLAGRRLESFAGRCEARAHSCQGAEERQGRQDLQSCLCQCLVGHRLSHPLAAVSADFGGAVRGARDDAAAPGGPLLGELPEGRKGRAAVLRRRRRRRPTSGARIPGARLGAGELGGARHCTFRVVYLGEARRPAV
mmetsp:Transcript_72402/g.183210  ORF Transcript_72402/g.183210 Transcript_72402/m.183210 type:complete len:274 (+) Transcript_72402:944-1765(+)